jgi:3-deoxy-D-manno-octulosonate 8-phosphate phosphatase (KDO 8-P phosphatase)
VVKISAKLAERCAAIKLLAMDVDGVLTDGGMYYSEHGDELKKFNTRDGKGIELLRAAGIKVVLITSEDTLLVVRRAEKLKVDGLYQGVKDKAREINDLREKYGVSLKEIAFIGDDVNDFSALEMVGVAFTVADGLPENKEVADYITQNKGGEGAVREVATLILASKTKPITSKTCLHQHEKAGR